MPSSFELALAFVGNCHSLDSTPRGGKKRDKKKSKQAKKMRKKNFKR